MQPQDDPEARIRDLERPLADVARTSELGTSSSDSGGYNSGAYMPPPVPAYGAPPYQGAPYLGAPQKAKSGFSAWWLFAGLAVLLIVIAGGVVIFSATMFKLDSDTRPPIEIPEVAGGGGEVDKAPSGPPGRPGGGSVVETPSAEPAIPPSGELHSVSGSNENETIACNEGMVSVSGVDNIVTITGHCLMVSVSGVRNVVTLEATETISASGVDNQVTYLSGDPDIHTSGSSVVSRG